MYNYKLLVQTNMSSNRIPDDLKRYYKSHDTSTISSSSSSVGRCSFNPLFSQYSMILIILSVISISPMKSFISHQPSINVHQNKWFDVCFSSHSQFALSVMPHLFKFSLILSNCALKR